MPAASAGNQPERRCPNGEPDENFLYGFKGGPLRGPPARLARRACGLFGPTRRAGKATGRAQPLDHRQSRAEGCRAGQGRLAIELAQ